MTGRLEAAGLLGVLSLIALQGIVVGMTVLVPRANPSYRATYLDHTIDCWPAHHGGPSVIGSMDVIIPRTLTLAAACVLLPKGWNPPDAWGVWSNGSVARINVPIRAGDAQVILRMRGYAADATQTVNWSTPGHEAGVLEIPPGRIVPLTVDVLPNQKVLRLTLEIRHVHSPLDTDIADWRAIGVALIDITRLAVAPDPDAARK